MLLRNADGSITQKNKENENIYFDCDPGFYFQIDSPTNGQRTAEVNKPIDIKISSSHTSKLKVYADNILIKEVLLSINGY